MVQLNVEKDVLVAVRHDNDRLQNHSASVPANVCAYLFISASKVMLARTKARQFKLIQIFVVVVGQRTHLSLLLDATNDGQRSLENERYNRPLYLHVETLLWLIVSLMSALH